MSHDAATLKSRMKTLNLQVRELAAIYGVSETHVSANWRGGRQEIPERVWHMLDAMEQMSAADRRAFIAAFITPKITDLDVKSQIKEAISKARVKRHKVEGSLFRTDSAGWLAEGERAVGVVGGFANMVTFSPAGARADTTEPRLLYYGRNGAMDHEEVAAGDDLAWFDEQFTRTV